MPLKVTIVCKQVCKLLKGCGLAAHEPKRGRGPHGWVVQATDHDLRERERAEGQERDTGGEEGETKIVEVVRRVCGCLGQASASAAFDGQGRGAADACWT